MLFIVFLKSNNWNLSTVSIVYKKISSAQSRLFAAWPEKTSETMNAFFFIVM